MIYEIDFTASALKQLKKLGASVKSELVKQLKKVAQNPHQPSKRLSGDLKGRYKIKLRSSGYRAVYSVKDDVLIVTVIAIAKRDDVYKH